MTKGGKAAIHIPPPGERVRAMPSVDAFFDPEPRLDLMRDMGIDRTLLPTLASSLETRLKHDPDALCVVVHALNQWLHEHWGYVYEDAIFSTPIITLATLEGALAELDYIVARGAKIFLLRACGGHVEGLTIVRPPRLRSVLARVQELGLLVGMHSGDPTYAVHQRVGGRRPRAELRRHGHASLPVLDVAEGLAHRLDGLDNRAWPGYPVPGPQVPAGRVREHVDPAVRQRLHRTYEQRPQIFDEDPFVTFTRSIYLHVFHEPDPQGLLDLGIPADHLMFGSDFPHPEGMADPLAYSEIVEPLPKDAQTLIMGGTLERLLLSDHMVAWAPVGRDPRSQQDATALPNQVRRVARPGRGSRWWRCRP